MITNLGLLCRVWRRTKRKADPEAILVMARRTYKIYANIRLARRATKPYAVALDTGAASSFIRKDVISQRMWNLIKTSKRLNVRDANNCKVHTSGTIALTVEVRNRVEVVNFIVVEQLATNVLLG